MSASPISELHVQLGEHLVGRVPVAELEQGLGQVHGRDGQDISRSGPAQVPGGGAAASAAAAGSVTAWVSARLTSARPSSDVSPACVASRAASRK